MLKCIILSEFNNFRCLYSVGGIMMGLVETVVAPVDTTTARPPIVFDEGPDVLLFPEQWLVRTLACGESLFRAGDSKTHIIRVETGILSVTSPRAEGPPEIVELVFPGGFLGLGFLKHHIYNATAVIESKITLWPLDLLPALCEQSAEASEGQALATERDFAYRRHQLEASTKNSPFHRLAAFLIAVSQLNQLEGRDPCVIEERPSSGEVADFLGMDLTTLKHALAELQRCELVSHDQAGKLILLDPAKLEDVNSCA